jgi:aldehyde dehydrogenase (NAD+)
MDSQGLVPSRIDNWIDGAERQSAAGETFVKVTPHDGRRLCAVARSRAEDVRRAVAAARRAQPAWAERTPVQRGDVIRAAALLMRERADALSRLVALEAGKPLRDARGETGAAIEMGFFVSGEGRRFYGRTTTSAVPNKTAQIVRQPLGVAGLIIAANTPLPNLAWKAFPALLCGNTAVMKPAEDTPVSAWAFARILAEAGVPEGVFNVVHGFGEEAGAPLVESPEVDVVSFTGSCEVGRYIQRTAGSRLAKVCVELGGKNPLVVCDDADVDLAVEHAAMSAFSNAGQRCASGSRLIAFDAVYDDFRRRLLERTARVRVGVGDDDDLGPVINEGQLQSMLAAIEAARARGVEVIAGGRRLSGPGYDGGFYLAPTLLEGAAPADPISRTELFGPVAALYRVRDFAEALALANDSPYGLTAAIHTTSIDRAMAFVARVQAGVAVVNGPTYGSEPHMPFGGLKQSGNGFREAGTEALEVYSDWKTVYVNFDPKRA